MTFRSCVDSLVTSVIIGLAIALGVNLDAVAQNARILVPMNLIDSKGIGNSIGFISAGETASGFLLLKLKLTDDLPPGAHGFHVHEMGNCGPGKRGYETVAGLAAGGHYDPLQTGKHEGPSGDGHLGDLPIIYVEVDEDGALEVDHSVVAPRLNLSDIRGRALVIHAGSDNYSDEPRPLGGSGARIACGVVPR